MARFWLVPFTVGGGPAPMRGHWTFPGGTFYRCRSWNAATAVGRVGKIRSAPIAAVSP